MCETCGAGSTAPFNPPIPYSPLQSTSVEAGSAPVRPRSAWTLLVDPAFAAAAFANATAFAMRQGGRNTLVALFAVHSFDYSPVHPPSAAPLSSPFTPTACLLG